MTRKAFKYRLYPTQPQARDLERTLALCRQLYNAALQERREAYKKAGKTVGFYEQKRYLSEIRTELPEYKGGAAERHRAGGRSLSGLLP
jgi:putative transposase